MSRPLGTLIKENAVLIAGVCLPLLLILLFVVARAIPAKTVPDPQYKAVFAQQPWYNGHNFTYNVNEAGKLVVNYKMPKDTQIGTSPNGQKAHIYIFDGTAGTSRDIEVSIPEDLKPEETKTIDIPEFAGITLSGKDQAPDGYIFRQGSYSGSSLITEIFAYNSRHQPNALVKNNRIIPLRPQQLEYYDYGGGLTFIGWVTKE